MKVVADASVALKWIFRDAPGEADVARALSLLDGVRKGTIELTQPDHWVVEVAQVTVLKAPGHAKKLMADLRALPFQSVPSADILDKAIELSARLKHHLFDVIYHVVALEHGALFLTADDRYFAKAFRVGNIKMLTGFGGA